MTLVEALADAIEQIEGLASAYHDEGFSSACRGSTGNYDQCENCQGPIRPLREALERARSKP